MDCCGCEEKYKTSGLNNTNQPSVKVTWFEVHTVVFQAGQKEHLAAGLYLESFPLQRAGEAVEGRAAVEASAVWQRPILKLCISVFLTPLCQLLCLLSFGYNSWRSEARGACNLQSDAMMTYF